VFCNKTSFYGEELSTPHPTTQLEVQPLSAVCYCLCTIFTATLYIGGCSSICNLRTCYAMVTGIHLSWLCVAYVCFILVFYVLLHCATSAFVCMCVRVFTCVLVKGTVCVGCSLKFRRWCCSHFICFYFDSSLLSCRN